MTRVLERRFLTAFPLFFIFSSDVGIANFRGRETHFPKTFAAVSRFLRFCLGSQFELEDYAKFRYFAALTIAKMPALIARGRSGQAAMTEARSGSELSVCSFRAPDCAPLWLRRH